MNFLNTNYKLVCSIIISIMNDHWLSVCKIYITIATWQCFELDWILWLWKLFEHLLQIGLLYLYHDLFHEWSQAVSVQNLKVLKMFSTCMNFFIDLLWLWLRKLFEHLIQISLHLHCQWAKFLLQLPHENVFNLHE